MGGHGHGHGGHGPHYPEGAKIPDWKQWNVIDENFPELVKYRDRLAKKGLKDPFIRDYAWVFDRRVVRPWDSLKPLFSGFYIGAGIFAAIVIKKTFYDKPVEKIDRYPLLNEMQDRDFQ